MTDQHASAREQRQIVGRYVVLEEIGRGGMGVVWRAEDTVIGRRVAVKELRLPEGVPQQERSVLEERVLREARSAGRLNDPSVVTVFDVVSEDETTYIVMELVEAPTLSDLVRAHGPLPAPQVADLGRRLLHALHTAHSAGIVHRDVKPSNIMVFPDGRAKLTDFGIAQAADDPRLTSTGLLVGSATYMAPERISDNAATPASDLWALGATLFYAVEGRAPFERPSTAATLHAIMNEVPYLTRCQGPLASVISGLMISAPSARISSEQAGTLLDAAAARPELSTGQPSTASHTHAHQSVTSPMGGPATSHLVGQASGQPTGATTFKKIVIGSTVVLLIAGLAFGGGFLTHRLVSSDDTVARPEAWARTVTYGTPDGDLPESPNLTGFSIDVGSCGNGDLTAGPRDFTEGSALVCESDHDFEVFRRVRPFDLADGVEYPGQEPLTSYIGAVCGINFSSHLIEKPESEEEQLAFTVIVPTAAEWSSDPEEEDTDSNLGYCVLHRADGRSLDRSMIHVPEE
ncbi:serine/threonine-protein kinase [Actinoalloteichus hymeniacidonis]|uniref:non-specific serine/threonine protein kinase n=1 Tax=Actinoalloteichus hymeniacidonis TaxID=340345 RepID=A0AAC9MYV5_9PSEU|nr:serine/threonine-protein kinase [Actinoalloteichus hymeniacidonis]AOS63271.1 protein kinase family protein [Actinoalloteichus hymeniacidonis]MBB5908690.1 serine/threonine protein kinase [Actinoalloteichus hymeniacidonis]